jgi:hypothetical protein
MAGQPTPHEPKPLSLLLIAPFAALALFLAVYVTPAAPEGGSVFLQAFIYALIAALITGIWAGMSQVRWSGVRFLATFGILLTVGLAMMSLGRMSTAKATDPAAEKSDPWIVLSQ